MKITPLEREEILRYMQRYSFTDSIIGKTFLVTGAKGIVGQGIIKWLMLENEIHHTNTKVIASTRKPEIIPNYLESTDQVVFCEFGSEAKAVSMQNVDYVIHAATSTDNHFHMSNPVESLSIIIDGTRRMLEITASIPQCTMLYISSEEVYGLPNTDDAIPESYVGAIDSLNIRNCYPLGKKLAELLCVSYAHEYHIDVRIIRPTVIQGLFQPITTPRVVNEILRCVLEGENLLLRSRGLTKKCVLYSLDAISAIFTVLFHGETGMVYNASNPETFLSVKALAEHIFQRFNPACSIEYISSQMPEQEGYLPQRSIVQQIDRICALGWYPLTGLDELYEIDIKRFAATDE